MSIRYKFKNELCYSNVVCDEPFITVHSLKVAIVKQRQKSTRTNFDLDIMREEDKKIYSDDGEFIRRNSSVFVVRKPVVSKQKYKLWQELSEANRIEEISTASADMYSPKYWEKKQLSDPNRQPPRNYKCRKCNTGGHWVSDCTHKPGDKVLKPTTGIPRSFLSVARADTPGARITIDGAYMVTDIEKKAHELKKAEKPIWAEDESVNDQAFKDMLRPKPKELICPLCNDLFTDCVLLSACACAFCDDCIQMILLESDDGECPACGTKGNSVKELLPCRYLRRKVKEYLKPSAAKKNTVSNIDNKQLEQPKGGSFENLDTEKQDLVKTSQAGNEIKGSNISTEKESIPNSSQGHQLPNKVAANEQEMPGNMNSRNRGYLAQQASYVEDHLAAYETYLSQRNMKRRCHTECTRECRYSMSPPVSGRNQKIKSAARYCDEKIGPMMRKATNVYYSGRKTETTKPRKRRYDGKDEQRQSSKRRNRFYC